MTNKYALITGAASGMGRHYAFGLAEKGYGLVVVDINQQLTDELCEELRRKYDVPVVPAIVDLTSITAVEEISAICEQHQADVEVLINNAGMLITTPIADTDPVRLQRIIMLHCTTPLLLCRYFVPLMQQRGCGYVLNISSICAWMEWPVIGMYGNTKRFVKGYSRSLRIECRNTPVSVTTAFFGAVDTPLFSFPAVARKWMLRLGVMISPEKAVEKALGAMFKRKKTITPGILNRISLPLYGMLPEWLLHKLAKRYGHYLAPKTN